MQINVTFTRIGPGGGTFPQNQSFDVPNTLFDLAPADTTQAVRDQIARYMRQGYVEQEIQNGVVTIVTPAAVAGAFSINDVWAASEGWQAPTGVLTRTTFDTTTVTVGDLAERVAALIVDLQTRNRIK